MFQVVCRDLVLLVVSAMPIGNGLCFHVVGLCWSGPMVVPYGFCTLLGRAYDSSALRLRLLALGSVGPYPSGRALVGLRER